MKISKFKFQNLAQESTVGGRVEVLRGSNLCGSSLLKPATANNTPEKGSILKGLRKGSAGFTTKSVLGGFLGGKSALLIGSQSGSAMEAFLKHASELSDAPSTER